MAMQRNGAAFAFAVVILAPSGTVTLEVKSGGVVATTLRNEFNSDDAAAFVEVGSQLAGLLGAARLAGWSPNPASPAATQETERAIAARLAVAMRDAHTRSAAQRPAPECGWEGPLRHPPPGRPGREVTAPGRLMSSGR